MYKQSKSKEKRRVVSSEYSPSPKSAVDTLCPALLSHLQSKWEVEKQETIQERDRRMYPSLRKGEI